MPLAHVFHRLLSEAGPSIQYRLRRDILGTPPDAPNMRGLHRQILKDSRVTYVFGWQKPDGYLGEVFHSSVSPRLCQPPRTRGAEGAIRLLSEMGVRSSYRPFHRALQALLRPDWFRDKQGVCWKYYPELGMYGLDMVRAATLVSAGVEDHDFILRQQAEALKTMLGVLEFPSMDGIVETFKNWKVFKPGVIFPETYHLRLLGRSSRWRNDRTVARLAKAVEHLVDLSPFPSVKVRYKSRWLGPAAIYPHDLGKPLSRMSPREWWQWFHTFDLFARMGVVPRVRRLQRQTEELVAILKRSDGMFTPIVDRNHCIQWGPYSGLALEPFEDKRRLVYDLTFRSLLILHHTGILQGR